MRVVIDKIMGSNGVVAGEIVAHTEDPEFQKTLARLEAHPEERTAAGYNEICVYHGAPAGLTRWHHLQAAGVAKGVPEVFPPANPPQVGESRQMYLDRIAKGG